MRKKAIYVVGLLLIMTALAIFGFRNMKYTEVVKVYNNTSLNIPQIEFDATLCKSFKMDSLTEPSNIRYLETYSDSLDNREYLTFLNPDINTIYIYDLMTTELKRKINLSIYGFNMASKIQGYHMLNKDSLLVYSYKDAKLSLLSLKSGVVLSKTIGNKFGSNIETVHPFVSTRTPLLFAENKNVYLSGFSTDEGGAGKEDKNRNTVALFSLSSGDLNYGVHYPKQYWGVNWGGGGGLRQVFTDLMHDKLLVSFMADHNVYLFSKDLTSVDTVYFGSQNIKEIFSMNYSTLYFEFIPFYKVYDYYLTTPNYSIIKYDKYRGLLYRIAEHPELFKVDGILKKKKSVMVMNNNFKLLGEWQLPNLKYDINEMLVTKDALLLRKKGDSDEVLSFCELKMIPSSKF